LLESVSELTVRRKHLAFAQSRRATSSGGEHAHWSLESSPHEIALCKPLGCRVDDSLTVTFHRGSIAEECPSRTAAREVVRKPPTRRP